jgi:glycosyltransferase involved in cell wall biosynthesis
MIHEDEKYNYRYDVFNALEVFIDVRIMKKQLTEFTGSEYSSYGVQKKKVLLVAAFCPPEREGITHLGASTKIHLILQGLLEVTGEQPVLLNSGHQGEELCLPKWMNLPIGGITIPEFHPLTLSNRPVGRLLQAALAPIWSCMVLKRFKPDILWLYNCLLFESLTAWTIKILSPKTIVVLEFEDLPNARKREKFGAIKSFIDIFSMWILKPCVKLVTVVNPEMRSKFRIAKEPFYFPVILRGGKCDSISDSLFVNDVGRLTGGYFGGLEEGKGCLELLEVIEKTANDVHWAISGSGPLEQRFSELARKYPKTVIFYGRLSSERFLDAYGKVDFIVNFHRPLEDFGCGVFPFKLLEAIYEHKIVVSTLMKGCPSQVEPAIIWIKGDPVVGGVEEILKIASEYSFRKRLVIDASKWLAARYLYSYVVKSILVEALSP